MLKSDRKGERVIEVHHLEGGASSKLLDIRASQNSKSIDNRTPPRRNSIVNNLNRDSSHFLHHEEDEVDFDELFPKPPSK